MNESKRLIAWNNFLIDTTRPDSNQRNIYAQWWRNKKLREDIIEATEQVEIEEIRLISTLTSLTSAFSDLNIMIEQIGEALDAQKAALGPFYQAIQALLSIKENIQIKRLELEQKKSKLKSLSSEYFPKDWPS